MDIRYWNSSGYITIGHGYNETSKIELSPTTLLAESKKINREQGTGFGYVLKFS